MIRGPWLSRVALPLAAIAVSAALLVVFGCGDSEGRSPAATAGAFARAVQAGDAEAVLELVDQVSADRYDAEAVRAQLKGLTSSGVSLEVGDIEVIGDRASVEVVAGDSGDPPASFELKLIREGGRWKVDYGALP